MNTSAVYISETKGDGRLFPIGSLLESAQGKSNGHVTMTSRDHSIRGK